MKPEENDMWFVVVAQGSVVLGVYGSALRADAQRLAEKIGAQTGVNAFVDTVTGPRPHVGMAHTSAKGTA